MNETAEVIAAFFEQQQAQKRQKAADSLPRLREKVEEYRLAVIRCGCGVCRANLELATATLANVEQDAGKEQEGD